MDQPVTLWRLLGRGPGRGGAVRASTVWREDPRHLANHLVTALLTGGLGPLVLFSDPDRFSSPSYLALKQTPGGIATWAWLLIASGIVLLASSFTTATIIRLSLLATGAVHLLLAYTFVVAQGANEGASPWGWWLLGGLALRHAMQALWFSGPSATATADGRP